MTRSSGGIVLLAGLAVAGAIGLRQSHTGRASAEEPPAPPAPDAALAGSTISVVLKANDGKVPRTGKELWAALARLGKFAQLPVVFSAVRLDSGIGNPRVVLAAAVDSNALSDTDVTAPNLNGRLFLAANMERGQNGADPHVASVEFISWNALRRRFDFGVIEDMGGPDAARLRVVDGGRCFSCHKNKGPILGAGPWTNTAHHGKLRTLVSDRLKIVGTVPAGAAGAGLRDRIDGMALAAPQALPVDNAVRLGAIFGLNRDTFRMMTASDGGRKALVALFGAIVQPGPLDPADKKWKAGVDPWGNDPSYTRFTSDWVATAKATNIGVLADFAPVPKSMYEWNDQKPKPLPQPPTGGFRSAAQAKAFESHVALTAAENLRVENALREKMAQLTLYDQLRATGKHGVPSAAQPSNPKAFVQPPPKATPYPSGMVNPLMLANTIGLTEGDRKFMSEALADAAARLTKQKVTAAALAKAVFEAPEFADVLAGGALPDRDDFKDRFVAGLDAVLTTKYKLAEGFAPDRRHYARDPRRDPKAVEAAEVAAVPTSACLRCHDVRDGAKGRVVEPIPALAFDPFDEPGRAAWLRTAGAKHKQEVLARLRERLHTDADMPPHDSPEHDLFRVKQAAAFDAVKRFLDAELEKLTKP